MLLHKANIKLLQESILVRFENMESKLSEKDFRTPFEQTYFSLSGDGEAAICSSATGSSKEVLH